MLTALLRGVRENERRILAQAITLVESTAKNDQALASELLKELHSTQSTNDPIRIGICGPPGAGKSSLIESLGSIALHDDPENKVAVLAYDPSSIVAGGSFLGDKPRMTKLATHPRCFIRPSPSGSDGSITRSSLDVCSLLQAAGYDAIMVETVGSGQADVDVRDLVDILLYAVTANTGDWLQAMKRGITEVADILVVTKADIDPTATKQALKELSGHHSTVLNISAHKNEGTDELWKTITSKFFNLSRNSFHIHQHEIVKLEGKDDNNHLEQQGEMLAMQEDIASQQVQQEESVPATRPDVLEKIEKNEQQQEQVVQKPQSEEMHEDKEDQHIEVMIGEEEEKMETAPAQASSTTEKDPALIKEQLKYCFSVILRGLKRHKDAGPFQLPVDPIALGIPEYPNIIKKPMDLSTISKKMEQQEYKAAEMFFEDVRLMLDNCFTFNAPESQVHKMGKNMERYFENSILRMPQDLQQLKSDSPARRSSNPVTPVARPRRDTVSSPGSRRSSAMSNYVPSTPGRKPSSGELTFCRAVLTELCKKAYQAFSWPFMNPVDPVVLGIPDYFDVIKQPMDIGTIRKKLDHREYMSAEQFEVDVRLVFSNCYAYNAPDSEIVTMAKQLEQIFENKWATRSQFAAQQHQQHHQSVSVGGDNDDERILAISRQIQILQNELNDLLMRKKSGGSKPKSRPSTTPTSALPMTGSVPAVAMSGKPPKPSFEELCKVELTFEEKRDLSEVVNNMPPEKLVRVVEIINESMPSLKDNADSELIELDIESLDIRTLRRLQQYIRECKMWPKKRKSTTSKPPAKKTNAAATAGMGPDSNAMPFPAESDSDDEEEDEDI